jgi:hypothetical protein
MKEYRLSCANVLFQVYLPFPVMLSQLVTVLVYFQLLLTLVSFQNSHEEGEITFYFPIFTVLESLVYIGALRVGQIYCNPLGADDDDYEVVSFFNRNLRLANIYGLYGDSYKPTAEFDISANVPPLVSLLSVQQECMPSIPVEFYSLDNSKHGAVTFDQSELADSGTAMFEPLTLQRAAKNRKSVESRKRAGSMGGLEFRSVASKGQMTSSSSEPCLNPLNEEESMSEYIAA